MSMMKQGSRGVGNGAQAHRRARHDAIPSGLDLERGRAISDYVKVVGLAACSIAISILMWRLRPGSPPEFHLLGHNHQQPRKPGIVFPLYQYYHQWGNRSHRERSGRGLRAENPLFDLRWIFIEMKLGEPPKPFYLHIDTGSGQTWVLYANGKTLSIISSLGPNGLLVTEEESVVAYIGPTESLCRAHTSDPEHNMRCEEEDDYACFFSIMYADSSVYLGVVVNESMTLSMQDASEKRVFTLFGCVLEKHSRVEKLPLLTDGVDGLGRCEGSLVDQLWTSNVIQKKILGVCLAKELRQRPSGPLPAGRVGFISLGMDFSSKFDSQNLVWSKLAGPE